MGFAQIVAISRTIRHRLLIWGGIYCYRIFTSRLPVFMQKVMYHFYFRSGISLFIGLLAELYLRVVT